MTFVQAVAAPREGDARAMSDAPRSRDNSVSEGPPARPSVTPSSGVRPSPAPVASEVRRPSPTPPAPARLRILHVDDEPMVLALVRRMLAKECDIVSVSSPQEALELLSSPERFDCVLSDVTMPAMTGVSLLRRIEAIAPDMARRFVFFTSGSPDPWTRAFLLASPHTVLEKGASRDELVAALRKAAGP